MKVYIVLEFPKQQETNENLVVPFIVGIFDRKKLAQKVVKQLRQKNKKTYMYLIEDYEINSMYFKTQEEVDREISECIEEMVKEGLLDYKIGEDGKFYFETTDKGKEELE